MRSRRFVCLFCLGMAASAHAQKIAPTRDYQQGGGPTAGAAQNPGLPQIGTSPALGGVGSNLAPRGVGAGGGAIQHQQRVFGAPAAPAAVNNGTSLEPPRKRTSSWKDMLPAAPADDLGLRAPTMEKEAPLDNVP